MERNKALQAELIDTLENIQNKLNAQNKKLYGKELDALKAAILQSLKVSPQEHTAFFEKNSIVKGILKIIHKIDKEIATVEKEMHGMEFYPSSAKRLDDITFKKQIKDELATMRDKVIRARHEVSDALHMMGKRLK